MIVALQDLTSFTSASVGYELTVGTLFIKDSFSFGGTYPKTGEPLISGKNAYDVI